MCMYVLCVFVCVYVYMCMCVCVFVSTHTSMLAAPYVYSLYIDFIKSNDGLDYQRLNETLNNSVMHWEKEERGVVWRSKIALAACASNVIGNS